MCIFCIKMISGVTCKKKKKNSGAMEPFGEDLGHDREMDRETIKICLGGRRR